MRGPIWVLTVPSLPGQPSYFFWAGAETMLIAFSADTAQRADDEAGLNAIRRADQVPSLAMRAGKKRVLGA